MSENTCIEKLEIPVKDDTELSAAMNRRGECMIGTEDGNMRTICVLPYDDDENVELWSIKTGDPVVRRRVLFKMAAFLSDGQTLVDTLIYGRFFVAMSKNRITIQDVLRRASIFEAEQAGENVALRLVDDDIVVFTSIEGRIGATRINTTTGSDYAVYLPKHIRKRPKVSRWVRWVKSKEGMAEFKRNYAKGPDPLKGVYTFDGVDGSGKTTLINSLKDHYTDLGVEVIVFNWKDYLNEWLGDTTTETLGACWEEVARLVIASPADALVLVDRYAMTTAVYQGDDFNTGVSDSDGAYQVYHDAYQRMNPSTSFIMVGDVTKFIARSTTVEGDANGNKGLDFYQRAQTSYIMLGSKAWHNTCHINADKPADEIAAEVRKTIDAWLQTKTEKEDV